MIELESARSAAYYAACAAADGTAELPRAGEVGVDARVLAFTLAVSTLAGLAFSLFPIVHYGAPDLAPGS